MELLCWLLLLASLCHRLADEPPHTCGPILSGSCGLSAAEGVGRSVRAGGAGARDSRLSRVQVEEVVRESVQSLSSRVFCHFPWRGSLCKKVALACGARVDP